LPDSELEEEPEDEEEAHQGAPLDSEEPEEEEDSEAIRERIWEARERSEEDMEV